MAHDVFFSYSQPDRDCAFAIVQRLEARGIGVWIAPRDVSPGTDWAAQIIDAISTARIMLLVFSSSSNNSPQVRREVERAVHKELPVLPFRIEDVRPSGSLEYFLSTQHWMDAFPPPLESHVDRLCDYLHATLGSADVDDVAEVHTAAPGVNVMGSKPLSGAVDPAELRLLEVEFAHYIGPVAGYLVRRAMQAGGDLGSMAQRLAAEIDNESQRQAFLEACWQIGHRSG